VSDVRVHFLGSGDAFASGGRLQSATLIESGIETGIETGGERLLVDCGATALVSLKRAGVDTASLGAVVITHLHGDHFGGLPFLLLDMKYVARRTAPLTLAGPPGLAARLAALRVTLYPPEGGGGEPSFPVDFVSLELGDPVRIGGATVTALPALHPSGAPPLMLRIDIAGKTLAFTGDTGWTDDILRLAEGADLLVAECSTYDRPLPHHLDYRTLAAHRAQLGCKRLILNHLGPEVIRRAEAGDLEIESARDGLSIPV
jgi:ribonuclease BN (tRNA processing enzyme)